MQRECEANQVRRRGEPASAPGADERAPEQLRAEMQQWVEETSAVAEWVRTFAPVMPSTFASAPGSYSAEFSGYLPA
ncbi:hypothetical protein OG884_16530 [Streptosporangium sp. NBC_01755]|uniref:hypothetical protein n=1 Tax=unclassified Streptosporangium TaxID=2632669 RepID=UPI002DDAB8D4|nr:MULTISPECIES: hypothetical protein [unclassified Streptosporangium]WSA29798.1 hypothetical protein OIE13_30700 [Streptosporangium sp. NBC_01810]WSD04316.1 hypothetical protein OG884_16530 [Streptosporangium sp. NBC_01755]